MAPPPPPKRKLNSANSSKEDSSPASKSLVLQFDELIRRNQILLEPSEDQFLTFLNSNQQTIKRVKEVEDENARLHNELGKSVAESRGLEQRLQQARNLLSETSSRVRRAEQERDVVAQKFDLMRELLVEEQGNTLNNETRQKLNKLHASVSSLKSGVKVYHSPDANELSVVNELESTSGSILDASDLSFDATCDPTLDESRTRSGRNFKRKSAEPNLKRRSKKSRSSHGGRNQSNILDGLERSITQEVVANTRKSLEKIAARRSMRKSAQKFSERNIDDYVASAPPLEDNASECWKEAHDASPQKCFIANEFLTPRTPSVQRSRSNAGINGRRHMFEQKKMYNFETCGPCGNKTKWGKLAFKCRDCRTVAHPECRDKAPLPCIGPGSVKTTPGKTTLHALADFAPNQSPMVPALIVHCVNELEKRGMYEVGLFRVPGSEREVKELKDKFLRGRGCPNLSTIDIHVLCGCIKDFLRGLREPLIPSSMWTEFVQATSNPDQTHGESALLQVIENLPLPNRDTLSFVLLHLRRVAEVVENKMTISNLSKILGPTIIGYSSPNLLPENIMPETGLIAVGMEKLLDLDSDYWSKFLEQGEGEKLYPGTNVLSPGTPETFLPAIVPRNTPKFGHKKSSSIRNDQIFFSSPFLS